MDITNRQKTKTLLTPRKLNSHPTEVFDSNIYKGEGLARTKSAGSKGASVKPFRYTSPGKHPAGCKAGTFNIYPESPKGPFTVEKKKKVTVNSSGKLYQCIPGPKTKPSPSVISKNVNQGMR